jgi:hypothetical protein
MRNILIFAKFGIALHKNAGIIDPSLMQQHASAGCLLHPPPLVDSAQPFQGLRFFLPARRAMFQGFD